MRTLIAGLGNIFDSDDGFGVAVIAELTSESWPDGVEVRDYGIRGVHLAYQLLEGYDLVVIVDAVSRGQAPGTVFVIEHGADPDRSLAGVGRGDEPMVDSHDLNPDAVLALVPELGGELGRVVVIGCEPQSLGPGMELSPAVAGSVEKAAELVRETVRSTVVEVYENGTTAQAGGSGRPGRGDRGERAGHQALPQTALDVTVA
jgi:hydrogenase maturation protease